MPPSFPQPGPASAPARGWLKGTAPRIFFIMLAVLLPLAVGAIISNWEAIRTAEQEKADLMSATTRQTAAQIASDFRAIRTSSSLTADVLATDPKPGNVCERLQRLLASIAGTNGIVIAIVDGAGTVKCGDAKSTKLIAAARASVPDGQDIFLAPELDGIVLRSHSRDNRLTSVALYRRDALQRIAIGNGREEQQAILVRQGKLEMALSGTLPAADAGNLTKKQALIGESDIELVFAMQGRDQSTRIISMLMPLVMWFTAALLGWLVVRWILIEPLIALSKEVAEYEPGKVIMPPRMARLASSEIVELGTSFREMSEDVAEHEDEMQQALDRQTRLTREVHHRVKNNLQIISSLISLHWRAAPDPATGRAYLSIQRRVDALSVVQRNHYAELDENRGVRARPMMNEITSGLKTSAQIQSGRNLAISVDCDDVYLFQDVAAPIAFMTAELADLVIALDGGHGLEVSLLRYADNPDKARFTVASPALRHVRKSQSDKVELYERVLTGLARQLRTSLEHDAERGEYHIDVPLTA